MNIAEIKNLLTSKTSGVVVTLTLIWVILDSNSRLFINEVDVDKKNVGFVVSPLPYPMLTKEKAEEIKTLFLPYTSETPKSANETIMSLEEQNKQQGKLETVYIDNNKLSLKAILRNTISQTQNKEIVALISIEDITTGEQKLEKFSHDSNIYGYRLTIESNTQVLLSKQHEQHIQKITLTMYK